MDFEEIMILLVTVIPLACVCFAITVRFALRPLIESVVMGLREVREMNAVDRPDELLRLREQVADLRDEMEKVRTAVEFDRRLVGGDRG